MALVSYSSPINQTGILFYNTLFDENASCHLAFGDGYPVTMKKDEKSGRTNEERGLNKSIVHVDFMFGTKDVECVGYKKDGSAVQIMENGEIII